MWMLSCCSSTNCSDSAPSSKEMECQSINVSFFIYIYIYIYIYSTKNLQDKLPITLHTNYLANTTRALLPRGAIDNDNPVAN